MPLAVDEAPRTNCMYCGRYEDAASMAAPTRKVRTWASVKLRSVKSRGGMIGSAARRSTRANQTREPAPSTPSPRICGDDQPYVVPPQLPSRVRARMPVERRAAPAKSMRAVTRSVRRSRHRPMMSRAIPPMGTLT